jgi:aspartate kinase
MKFGGASLAEASRVSRVVEIIRERRDRHPLVVVSAHGKTTNMLVAAANRALKGIPDADPIADFHHKLLRELGAEEYLVDGLLKDLAQLLHGISLVGDLTPRTLDSVMSFGERMSTRIVAAYLTLMGVPAAAKNSYDVGMVTDDRFGSAYPLAESLNLIREGIGEPDYIPIVTGFLGRTKQGVITTVGRNGSDFSASWFGRALGVSEIEVWKDAEGVMTADPTVVKQALPLEHMSYAEASELAYYGGRVLHPSTIAPAMQGNIPVRVLNTFNPSHAGTVIVTEPPPAARPVKSIVSQGSVTRLNIVSPRLLMQHGFMHRIFEVLARHEIVVNMIATSEVSVSLTTDSTSNVTAAVKELGTFSETAVASDMTIVCVIGEGIRTTPGVAGEVFATLGKAKINVEMISQGASQINIGIVVRDRDAEKTVKLLHDRFFGTHSATTRSTRKKPTKA